MRNKQLFYFLFSVIILQGCFTEEEKVNFYLPKGFSGNCVVMYDCNDGTSLLFEDGIGQIKVPPSGIVKLKDKPFFGRIKYRYFIEGNNKELKVYQSFQVPAFDSIYVGPGGIVTVSTFSGGTQKASEESAAFVFYVHKLGETIPSDYDDSWIRDTLAKQLMINAHFQKN